MIGDVEEEEDTPVQEPESDDGDDEYQPPIALGLKDEGESELEEEDVLVDVQAVQAKPSTKSRTKATKAGRADVDAAKAGAVSAASVGKRKPEDAATSRTQVLDAAI